MKRNESQKPKAKILFAGSPLLPSHSMPGSAGWRPGDVVRVLQDRAWVVASFDQSDAAWEEDMKAYLGQTGVVVEVDEVVTFLSFRVHSQCRKHGLAPQ